MVSLTLYEEWGRRGVMDAGGLPQPFETVLRTQ